MWRIGSDMSGFQRWDLPSQVLARQPGPLAASSAVSSICLSPPSFLLSLKPGPCFFFGNFSGGLDSRHLRFQLFSTVLSMSWAGQRSCMSPRSPTLPTLERSHEKSVRFFHPDCIKVPHSRGLQIKIAINDAYNPTVPRGSGDCTI